MTLRKSMSRKQVFYSMRAAASKTIHLKVEEHEEHAQSFLDTLVRQNVPVMDFGRLFKEHAVPITLQPEHRASYAKLSARLRSQRMQIRTPTDCRPSR